MLLLFYDMDHLCTKFFKDDSQVMVDLREGGKLYDLEYQLANGKGPPGVNNEIQCKK